MSDSASHIVAELRAMFTRCHRVRDRLPGPVACAARLFVFSLLVSLAILAAAGVMQTLPASGEQRLPSAVSPFSFAAASSDAPRGVEIVERGGYPELRVDGQPFFIHSAAFFYDRIPRDLWEPMLDRYKRLGINTIDIYIPWNWHEPREGEFDFDGHTNPRRDLRSLLALIAEKRLRLIARPGPEILNEWRHGGYPGWLLERPEYKMNPLDWIEGRYAPLDNLNAHNAEAAAQGWLDNSTHMREARIWMTAVARELAPYSSNRMLHARDQTGDGPHDAGGPLLFVQVGDDFAIERTNTVGTAFWRYVEDLRTMLKDGGLDVPVFINPTDMRVSAAGSAQTPPIGAMGQWYMHPRKPGEPGSGASLLNANDAAEIELFTEELKTQPDFPPVMIEYQAGWYTPADDDRPLPDPPSNTLLSSRLLMANGIHGFNYFPLQDTYTPAGYSVPWANRSYRWDAALSPEGDPQPRIQAVRRNAEFLNLWGPLLAASHKRADFGIIYPLGAYPQDLLKPEDVLSVSGAVMRIERVADLSMLSSELLDPEFQPVDELLRDPLLLLPVFDPAKPQFQLSARAQRRIVDYVRRGGTLVVFPGRPSGAVIGELWKDAQTLPATANATIGAEWKSGKGEVIQSSSDFYSWISLDQSFTAGRAAEAFGSASRVLGDFLSAAGSQRAVKFSRPERAADLIASEIVTDKGTGLLGDRTSGQGFLSVTNLSGSHAAAGTVRFLSPSESARGNGDNYLSIEISVPPRESLLLPLELPVCASNAKQALCSDTISSAGAEFLGAQREEKRLNLDFYVPARAEVNLHLTEKPFHVWLDETDTRPISTWTPADQEFHLTIPRGAAPTFRRTLKLEMAALPHFKKAKALSRAPSEDLDCYVANAVSLPTGGAAFIRTYPALIVPDANQKINVLLLAENRNEDAGGTVDLSLSKPLHGPRSMTIPAGGTVSAVIEFRKADLTEGGSALSADHLFHAAIQLRIGHDHRAIPVVVLLHAPGAQEHYRFDFDRDGADEWVLENDNLRLVVSPESGGRAIALTAKLTGESLSTSVGLLRDNFSFTENPPGISEARRRGRYGLFNRPYAAEWGGNAALPTLVMHYDAPDVFPSGATIEKTVQLAGGDTVRVDYQVALHRAPSEQGAARSQPQSFIAVNSFPAEAENGTPTRFCWQRKPPEKGVTADEKSFGTRDDQICRDFVPDGDSITVPAGTTAVEVHTQARPTIEVAWDCGENCGRMTIDPKYFSALFRLEFPPLTPGAPAAKYSVRIRVLDVP